MIKFRKVKMKFMILGKLKGTPIGLFSRNTPVDTHEYSIDFKIRFPYRRDNSTSKILFLPITLSAFYFGLRTKYSTTLSPSELTVIEGDSHLSGNFLLSQPFTLEKLNKSNVEYEKRTIRIISKRELDFIEIADKISSDSSSFEIFDVKINKTN